MNNKSTKTAEDRIKQLDVKSKLSFNNISKSAKTVAKGVGVLTAAIGTVGGALQTIAIKEGANFQQRISDISTLLDGSQKDFKNLGDQILGITDRVPVEGSVLSASLYDVVSAGIEGINNQLKVLEESSKLGIAGLGSTASAVDLMTSALNAFQLEADESDQVSNILFKTVKGGKTTIDQLAQSFGQVAFDELQAATAALTTSGLKTSVAQTQLKALFTDLNREGTKLSKAFKSIGIESVSTAIQQDGFVETLRRLKDEAHLSDVQFSNLFGSVEAAGAALSLTGAQSEKFKEILTDMRSGTDAITEAFEKQKSTFNNTFQLLENKVNKIFTQFGLEVLPAVTDALNDFSQFIDENQDSIDNLIRGFGEVAQVLASTLVSAFQFAVQVGGELVNIIKGLGDAFNELAAVLVGAGVYLTLTNLPLIFAFLKAAVLGLGTGLLQVGVGIKAIGASIASISALNVVFAAIAVTVGVLTYKYLELKKQIQEQIESIDQNIAKNQELKDSFSELGESPEFVNATP